MSSMGIMGVFYNCYMANTNVVYWGNKDLVCLLYGGYWAVSGLYFTFVVPEVLPAHCMLYGW